MTTQLRAQTLEAMATMPDGGIDAARRIVRHWHGIEFGIEYLPLPGGGEVPYVNAGDTYTPTLLRDSGEWIVTSWGDYYEEAERNHEQETGKRRCNYCGEWFDPDDGVCHDDG